MSWTDERVELLAKLWSEGLSASQIAKELGGVSRNAVIGKVHRLKLSARAKPSSSTKRVKKAAPASPSPTRQTTATQARPGGSSIGVQTSVVGATALQAEYVTEAVAEMRIQPQEEVVIPISRRLKLVQLSETTCKWPIGDPLDGDAFHFCGNDSEEGKPYCTFHCKLAFQPSSERRRVR